MGGMDAELARLSRATDPVLIGQRIRNARVAAGLTQEELGEGEASAAYISRIEAGNRRPGIGLLAHVAKRLGTSIEVLVADESAGPGRETELKLDYAELALKSGDPATALADVDEVLGADVGRLPGVSVVRARWIRAAAFEAQASYESAISEFEWLVAHAPKSLSWIGMAMALSRCHRESGELARAIEVGENAYAEIERVGLAGTEEAIRLTLNTAGAYIDRGELSQALRMTEQAAELAEQLGSDLARASAYWNASVLQCLQGDMSNAVMLAKRALAIFETDADARSRAMLRGVLADLQLRLEPPDLDAAEANIAKALDVSAWSDASTSSRANLQLTSARVLLRKGRVEDAQSIAQETLTSMEKVAPLVASDACLILGRIALLRRARRRAVEFFGRAALLLNACGADRYVAECWFELGALLQEVGEDSAAMDAYRSAAAATGLPIPAVSSGVVTGPRGRLPNI
jgi:transcriptional regulator with XRE-family HTH domain